MLFTTKPSVIVFRPTWKVNVKRMVLTSSRKWGQPPAVVCSACCRCSLKSTSHLSPSATNYCSRTINFGQYRTIPALRLKHRSGSCGTASALPKCSIMSGCGTRIVLRGQKPLALCDRCPCFGSLFPPLAALTFAASSIICAFGLASAAPRSPYRHLELCGIAFVFFSIFIAKKAPPDEKSGGAFFAYQVINVRAFPQHVTPCFPLFHAQTSFSTPSRTAFQSTA